ncbi:hypothetical protein PIB30_092489 [Stylosanthes scabra]|uniref:Uncharacterized protein n=1 Tax=Stylosanthes scabra TaxID=79078 RepID=A0ABU6WUX2_9FABA|nr:hypothetical protein [Stylosanthes scabra]
MTQLSTINKKLEKLEASAVGTQIICGICGGPHENHNCISVQDDQFSAAQVNYIAKQLTEIPPNTLPSDTIPNPREEYKAIPVIEMEEIPEVQVEASTEKPEIIAKIKNQEDIQHPPQSLKKHTSGAKTCMKINSFDPTSTKPAERSGKTIGNNYQDKESAEVEKKKKEPAAYMPKPPYPPRLKAE